jgi:FAD/FMN-containing dehydrogenase
MTITVPDWRVLREEIAGDVVLPGSPAYDAARRPALARFRDVHPRAVVRCANAADVAETIAFARRAGIAIAVRSGGHCFAGLSSGDGIVLDVGPMHAVAVEDGAATIDAGARLGAIYDALDAHGVTIPAGCGPRVGIAGLTLGGGLGILGRRHGLLCDSLLEAEVVLADGRVVDCDAERRADLFWALRGAGAAGFGVVTSLRFATVPAPAATRLKLTWPHAAAAAVAVAWQDWLPDAPDALAASLLVGAPADAAAPPMATVAGACAASEAETAALLEALVAGAGIEPSEAVLEHGSYRATKRALADTGGEPDPLERDHVASRSEFFARPLPAGAIAALIDHVAGDRRPGEARELDFNPLGGAYSRVPADATAFAHRDARVLLKHAAAVDAGAGPEVRARAADWLERSYAISHPFGTGGAYQNFAEPGREDWARAYYAGNLERLVAVKARYDPDDVFRGPQTIPAPARAMPSIG